MSSESEVAPPVTRDRRPSWRLLVGAVWLVIVCVLTVTPRYEPGGPSTSIGVLCLLCGDRAIADGLLNIALFVPLGVALGGRRVTWRWATVVGMTGVAVSLGIELAQLLVPGRYPTLADVVWNGAGATLGFWLVEILRRTLGNTHTSRLVGSAYSVGVGTWILASGWLLGAQGTDQPYWGQWTADLGSMPEYGGRLVSASLNGHPIPDTRFEDQGFVHGALEADWSLIARVMKGPPPPSVSPIVSIYDGEEREILLLGADGEDIVLRLRTRARALRLDSPDLRLEGGFRDVAPGDTSTLAARYEDGSVCLAAGSTEDCGLGHTPGRTWSLLLYGDGYSKTNRVVLDVLWSFALLFPLGFMAPSLRHMAFAFGMIAVLTALASAWGLLQIPAGVEAVAAVAGLGLGRVTSSWVRRGRHRASPIRFDPPV